MGTVNPLTTSPSVATWHTHHKGEKHEAFLAASRRNGRGIEGSTGCGSMSLIKEADGEIRIIPVLCGCWYCPICGPRRAAWLIAQTHGKVDAGELTEFWTLTLVRHISDPSERDVRDANVHLTAAWNRLRTALKAIYPHFVWKKYQL